MGELFNPRTTYYRFHNLASTMPHHDLMSLPTSNNGEGATIPSIGHKCSPTIFGCTS